MTQPRNVPLLNGYVQVLVRARLLTKEGVNTPPAINPNRDLQVLELRVEADYVGGSHISSRPRGLLSINWIMVAIKSRKHLLHSVENQPAPVIPRSIRWAFGPRICMKVAPN